MTGGSAGAPGSPPSAEEQAEWFGDPGQGVLENGALLVEATLETPARHPRTAVVIGRLLGAAFLICFATGLYSRMLDRVEATEFDVLGRRMGVRAWHIPGAAREAIR